MRGWILSASVLGTLVAGALALIQPVERDVFVVLALQVAAPGALLVANGWSGKDERYRRWGDSVFLLGAVPRLLA